MTIWPKVTLPPLVTIHPWSNESIGSGLNSLSSNNNLPNAASGSWPSANLAIYIPFTLSEEITAVKMFTLNGTSAANNLDIGIYDEAFTRLVSSGSTAQSGTNALQIFDITDTILGPGRYYMALASSGSSATFLRIFGSNSIELSQLGVAQQASAFALPANGTPAALSNTYIPVFGLTTRVVV
jgi:hypothetical protein